MKLTGNVELATVAALVGVIAFAPRLLSFLVETQVGKAVAFGFVAWLWKQHNELVALLLAVALLRSCPAYEHMTDTEKAAVAAAKSKAPTSMPPPPPMTTPTPSGQA
jgi:hypothetical protein